MQKESWIPNARDRLAQRRAEKPATKAGQIWALWPEIKACLDAGQSLKTVRQWLQEDAGLVLTDRAFAVYVSRSRRKEVAQRTAAAAKVFLRSHDPGLPLRDREHLPTGSESPGEQRIEVPEAASASVDPAAQTMQNLRKRRFDIRQAHRNGDPTDVKLI